MKKPIRTALVLGGLQLAVALLATVGHTLGWIDSDMALRITMIVIGLVMVFYANFTSKAVSRSARYIAIQRFVGWAMALGALAWTGIWVFAPMEVANTAAMAAVALSVLASAAYCVHTRPRTTT